MVSVNELRNGAVYQDDGELLQVLSYEHIKMGRGSANIKLKVRNVRSGSITEKSFINGARVQDAQVIKKEFQYLYKDDSDAYFMNPTTFEQITVPLTVALNHEYLKEGENYTISFFGDEPIDLILPPKLEFVIEETGPSLRGNSATNIYKDAVLENGLKTRVPLFMKVGDRVRIDTRTGAYSEKVQ